ncbi:DUF732 domain-containing protein [Mycolicibacterium sp. CBMA 234]|uniref:DUF732 domain-containing protein n=1 Tax=Mycolicibacterium sp. CBMA 234 TaxID=1918495 RepID=UPI001EE3CB47|nr:DUF732 domain-containing protein [Mycolicibacterium sp. CBMA 234]
MIAAALITPALAGLAFGCGPVAQADSVAYLVNVTMRPGYNFPNPSAALDYGYGVCDKIANREGFAQLLGDVKNDFNTTDEYQAQYLVTQAANELCPAQIPQLRSSAAHYVPAAG